MIISAINLVNNLKKSKKQEQLQIKKIESQEIKNKMDTLKLLRFENEISKLEQEKHNSTIDKLYREMQTYIRIIEALELENKLLKNQIKRKKTTKKKTTTKGTK